MRKRRIALGIIIILLSLVDFFSILPDFISRGILSLIALGLISLLLILTGVGTLGYKAHNNIWKQNIIVGAILGIALIVDLFLDMLLSPWILLIYGLIIFSTGMIFGRPSPLSIPSTFTP